MKRVVSLDEVMAADISPDEVYHQYVRLLTGDIRRHVLEADALVDVKCPGCGQDINEDIYERMQLQFKRCSACETIYVSPRPTEESLEKLYRESEACRYWRREILNYNASHMQHVHSPRINWIMELVDQFLQGAEILLDYQSKYPYFLKKLDEEVIFKSIYTFKPLLFEQVALLPCNIVETRDSVEGKATVVTAFETLERLFDPEVLFQDASKFCKIGGLFIMTTATCSGFEYQVLGSRATNINPINRMNLMSLEAIVNKIKDAGFEILELSTPGKLDVQLVRKTVENSPEIQMDSFWRYILSKRDEKTWSELQRFLQSNRLSSHVRIAARKLKS